MTRYEIVDFLDWAKDKFYLSFFESRKIEIADEYLKSLSSDNNKSEVCDVCGTYIDSEHGNVCSRCDQSYLDD